MMRYNFLRFPGGKPKALTFSYDDSFRQDIEIAEILAQYGMKGTFNLNGDEISEQMKITLNQEPPLTTDEVKKHVLGNGHEIAVHGLYHRATGALRPIEAIREVLDCRLFLEERYGMIIRGMAYPDSGIIRFNPSYNYEGVKRNLSDLGIAYSRTILQDNNSFTLPDDWYCWKPTSHHSNPKLFEWADEFINIGIKPTMIGCRSHPRLFYIWGHGHEFRSMDKLHKICQKFADCDDIWFATNIEIYDYVKAYKDLIYSADGNTVYNPSVITVWFDIDGTLYSVKPGETITIG